MRLDETLVASNYASLLLRLADDWGITQSALLEGTGIDPRLLEQSDSTINGEQFVKLVRNALYLTDDPELGLHYGLAISISTHGMLGFAFMTSSTIREAFEVAIKYHKTIFSLIDIRHESHDRMSHLIVEFTYDLGDLERVMIEGIFTGLFSVARFLMGDAMLPRYASFRHARPDYADKFDEVLEGGFRLYFDCPHNEIVFDESVLDVRLPAYDPQTRRMAEEHCERLLKALQQQNTFPDRVKSVLRANRELLPNLESLAAAMNLHPRTLGRRLGRHGTSYQALLDEVRQELAIEYLSESDMLIEDIAHSLNYNDASSFYRAFKRWTGKAPSSYRQEGDPE